MLLSIGNPIRRTGSASSPHALSLSATISDAALQAPFLCPCELLFSWPLSLPRAQAASSQRHPLSPPPPLPSPPPITTTTTIFLLSALLLLVSCSVPPSPSPCFFSYLPSLRLLPSFSSSHSFSARLLGVLLFLFLHLFLLSSFVPPPLWHPPLPLPSPMRLSFSCSYSFFPPSSMCLLLLPSPFSPLLSVLSHRYHPPPASFPSPLLLRHPHFAEVPLKTVRTVACDR